MRISYLHNLPYSHRKNVVMTSHPLVQSAFHEKVPEGVWCGLGGSVLVGGLNGCYWWKTV
jgi:hypothetical protein